ncbi:DUF1294 domain-containing protein [Chryseobacterium sp.]|uniref:DUF1294 domain-containing protein n=1 Tax=Chryseobacterium sp. TaxID=1871047 RepID=UPI0028A04B63|nr:DUF1294 domain-containing protein [Chryseobacterium sp.]
MIYWLTLSTLITFTAYAIDKYRAVRHKRRISEFFLLSLTFLGGTLGALLAMVIFRHKVSKKIFLLKLSGIIVLQVLICAGLWRLGVSEL